MLTSPEDVKHVLYDNFQNYVKVRTTSVPSTMSDMTCQGKPFRDGFHELLVQRTLGGRREKTLTVKCAGSRNFRL